MNLGIFLSETKHLDDLRSGALRRIPSARPGGVCVAGETPEKEATAAVMRCVSQLIFSTHKEKSSVVA
jgi:hypothetical protein